MRAKSRVVLAGTCLLAVAMVALPVHACVLVQDEETIAQEVSRSDQVFVARFDDFQQVSPPTGWRYMDNQVTWTLIETLKGAPPRSGKLVEADSSNPTYGADAGVSCGPFVVTPDRVGRYVLVMLSSEGCTSAGVCRPSSFSILLDDARGEPATGRMKQIQDLIRKEHSTP